MDNDYGNLAHGTPWERSMATKTGFGRFAELKRLFARGATAVFAFAFAAVLFPALGGTVITNNLPSNTAIVNIDARADGAGAFNPLQTFWYQPFNTNGTLLKYTVQQGTYSFRVVNPPDAAKLFPTLSTAQTNQIYTAWSPNALWNLNYLVFDSAAATNTTLPQLFDGDAEYPPSTTPSDAYNASIAHGTFNQIRVGARGGTTNITYSYTFTNKATLIFAAPDNAVSDNAGGVSVLVAPLPVLTIALGLGSVTLQWSTNSPGFTLASTANLRPAAWSDVANPPTVSGGNYSVTLPLDSTTRFFRLHQ
jgi:hypothetical protein